MALIKAPTKNELNEKGFTKWIKISDKQTKESLLEYGFTNHHKPRLYFSKWFEYDISFNLVVCADTLEILILGVLDEEWLQPYDYQHQILSGNYTKFAKDIYNQVNRTLLKLQDDGIIEGFEEGMYI